MRSFPMQPLGLLLTLTALISLGTAAAAQPAQPTIAALQSAALTVDEVGTGYAVQNQGPTDDNLAYVVTYARSLPNPAAVGIVLRLDAATSPASAAQLLVAGIQHTIGVDNFMAMMAPPPAAVGMNAVAYTISGSTDGMPVTGGVVVWQQGPVLVAVFEAGLQLDHDIATLATEQEKKLAAVLGM